MKPQVTSEPRHLAVEACPLCDAPAGLDVAAGRLDCPGCGASLELAADEPADLAAAA
jgi:hypothetical protein